MFYLPEAFAGSKLKSTVVAVREIGSIVKGENNRCYSNVNGRNGNQDETKDIVKET